MYVYMKLSQCLVAPRDMSSLCDLRELLEKMVKLVLLVLWAPRYVIFPRERARIAFLMFVQDLLMSKFQRK